MNQVKGFTLIEMMITVVIIAILAAIAVPAYNDYIEKGQIADAKQAAISMKQAVETNRIARPRDFQTEANFKAQVATEKAKISPRITQLYTFTETIVKSSNGIPLGFTLSITPKQTAKNYTATVDMQGNGERCSRKTKKCVKF